MGLISDTIIILQILPLNTEEAPRHHHTLNLCVCIRFCELTTVMVYV